MRTRGYLKRVQEEEVLRRNSISWASKLPAEIWVLVGQLINDRKTIDALIRTCRGFRDIFTPFFHRDHLLRMTDLDYFHLELGGLPVGAKYTKHLEVFLPDFMEGYVDYDESLNEQYAAYLVRLLIAMPNLRSFSWTDFTFESDYDTAMMLHDTRLLSVMKSSRIKHINIMFAQQYLDNQLDAMKCYMPLLGFCNLVSLELYNFFGLHFVLAFDIARALTASPQLKTLGLGMTFDFDCDRLPASLILEDKENFLEKLCTQFGEQNNSGQQLRLEILRLGYGMWLWEPSHSEDPGQYLTKLCDLSQLEVLHIYNGLGGLDPSDPDISEDESDLIEVKWSQLAGCKSIRQISVSRLTEECVDWIRSCGNTVREVIVMDEYGESTPKHDLTNFVFLPNLTTLAVHDKSLRTLPSVLKRLPDNGRKLEKLYLNLDFESQWAKFSTHLKKMPKLTQLRLEPMSFRGFRPKNTERCPKMYEWMDIAAQYILRMKELCPSLQYVRIDDDAWQIMPSLSLRQMEWDEMMTVDLFSMEDPCFSSVCGLPGPEQAHEHRWSHALCGWVDRFNIGPPPRKRSSKNS